MFNNTSIITFWRCKYFILSYIIKLQTFFILYHSFIEAIYYRGITIIE